MQARGAKLLAGPTYQIVRHMSTLLRPVHYDPNSPFLGPMAQPIMQIVMGLLPRLTLV